MKNRRLLSVLSACAAASLALTACTPSTPSSSDHDHAEHHEHSEDGHDHEGKGTEVSSLKPRLAVAYDGGILVLDGSTGKTLSTIKEDGFLRLASAGDGRNIMVTDGDEFKVLDMGLISDWHEDHYHYFIADPEMTEIDIDASHAGHVVHHNGKLALFADGSGEVQTMELGALEDGKLDKSEMTMFKTDAPHHGVAVPLANGNMLVTKGTSDERHTIQEVDAKGTMVQEFTDCPGVHGEAAAKSNANGDVVSFGCTNGSVVYRDGTFHKVAVEEAYQRSGNQFGSPVSEYTLTDYKTVKPVEGGGIERPTLIGVINTLDNTVKKIDLGSSYWFRSFGRGEKGEALVLTYDGELNIFDPATGQMLHEIKLVKPWTENEDWQQPGPNVKTVGDYAWVSDAAEKKIYLVQISTGELVNTFDLKVTPNEMAVVDGKLEDVTSK